MKRAQIAFEYLVVSAFALFVLIAFLSTAVYSNAQARQEISARDADRIAGMIQQELTIATVVHDGYSRTFILPERIQGKEYTIELFSDAVFVQADTTAIRKVPQVNGTLQPGLNILTKVNDEVQVN